MKAVLLLTLVEVFFASNFAFASAAAPAEVAELVEKLRQPTVTCPERIWTDYSWRGLQFIAVYPSKNSSWAWDVSNNRITEIKNSSLPASVLGSSYDFLEFASKSSASLNMEEEEEEGSGHFELITHEFFHNQGQKNWQQPGGSSRGTTYPLNWKPRYQRRMIYDHLKNYFVTGNKNELAAASFWYNNWKTQYPKEVLITADGYEGSAQYVEVMSSAIAKHGCKATESDLKKAALETVNQSFDFAVSGEILQLDSEGYSIGGLAALVLRFSSEKTLAEWNRELSKGKTALEILLDDIAPVKQTASKALAQKFYSKAKEQNAKYSKLLDSPIGAWADKSFVRLSLPYEWLLSNLMPQFFAVSEKLEIDVFPLYVEHTYRSPKGTNNLVVNANTVIFTEPIEPCGNGMSILVSRNEIADQGQYLTINGKAASGTIHAEQKFNSLGLEYLCPKDL